MLCEKKVVRLRKSYREFVNLDQGGDGVEREKGTPGCDPSEIAGNLVQSIGSVWSVTIWFGTVPSASCGVGGSWIFFSSMCREKGVQF